MRKIILLLLLLISVFIFSQDATVKELKESPKESIKKDPADTTVKTWKKGGMYGINISQGSLEQLGSRW